MHCIKWITIILMSAGETFPGLIQSYHREEEQIPWSWKEENTFDKTFSAWEEQRGSPMALSLHGEIMSVAVNSSSLMCEILIALKMLNSRCVYESVVYISVLLFYR